MISYSQHLGEKAEKTDSISHFPGFPLENIGQFSITFLCVVKTLPNSYIWILVKLWWEREILTL